MTSAGVLPIPEDWPRLLLPPATDDPAYNPTDLGAAVTNAGAFNGLKEAVRISAGEMVAMLNRSGLRGRGGAGFSTAEKWRACALAVADQKYVVVHGYQADPAVYTDRLLLERNPFAVLEGAAVAAVAVGASEVILALRADWPETVSILEKAVAEAEEAGYLGDDVLGSGRDIHVTIQPLGGAYMLGEETVLLKGIEGRRGQPEQQPPYTTAKGLHGKPTLIHNPQTFAVIPGIVTGGPETYASDEARGGRGTVLVQVSGSVANPGIAEVPIGTPLGEIVELAGGVPGPHTLKALLVGGPSGGILPAEAASTGYDFESLQAAGAYMGSGSIVVVDERSCMVDLATVLTRFCADQACGKTIPCRIGLTRLAEIGARFVEGQPRGDDVGRLQDLSADIVASRLCEHERRATQPLLSVVRYFREELDAHILQSTCPTGICQPLVTRSVAPRAGNSRATASAAGSARLETRS